MKRITEEETKFYRKLNPETDFKYSMREAIAFTIIPAEDNWEEVVYYGEAWRDPSGFILDPHYIYILVNPLMPGICKIGYTTNTVYERVKQLNTSTGVIAPWYPVYIYKCPNGKLLENDIHDYLEKLGKRVNDKREGFEIDSADAIKIVETIGDKYKNKTNE